MPQSLLQRLKPLCPTCWTARTGAVNAIIKDYGILLEALEEIQQTICDDHALKAGGLLHALNQFSTLFGLKLSHLLYSAAETVSLTLQRKDITLQDTLCAVEVATAYYRRLRSEEEFDRLYDRTVVLADYRNGQPQLHLEIDEGRHGWMVEVLSIRFLLRKLIFARCTYFEACDLLSGALEERFSSEW